MSRLPPSEGRFAHSPQVAIRKYNLDKVAMFPRCNFQERSTPACVRMYMIRNDFCPTRHGCEPTQFGNRSIP